MAADREARADALVAALQGYGYFAHCVVDHPGIVKAWTLGRDAMVSVTLYTGVGRTWYIETRWAQEDLRGTAALLLAVADALGEE